MKLTSTLMLVFAIYQLWVVVSAKKCESDSVWSWKCKKGACVKVEAPRGRYTTQLSTCKLVCGQYGSLWPKPTIETNIGEWTLPFFPTSVRHPTIECDSPACKQGSHIDPNLKWYIENAFALFRGDLEQTYKRLQRKDSSSQKCQSSGHDRVIQTSIRVVGSADLKLTLASDESYKLNISHVHREKEIKVLIVARSFFGVRHALETLSQLTAYDEVDDSMQIVAEAQIQDAPKYPYRGILLDTSRNFFSVENILRLITAMSYNKLNTLHWHITDTHSFPIEIKSLPKLTKYGAYSDRKIYTQKDVRRIVEHGRIRGVRVLPEFDQPAHVGNGWQWGEKEGLGKLAVCVDKDPWQLYCVEPPCGQLNPTNQNIYPVLGKIYKEYFDLFEPDIFHAGGDEVHINCWNTTQEIVDFMMKKYGGLSEENYMDLWEDFLIKSSDEIVKANGGKELPLILWTSHMTFQKYLTKYLDPKKHIIQIWSSTKDHDLANIVTKGFKTIFSTYDTLYLDCGYGNWLTTGNNWCSPYKDWKLYYNNRPAEILMKNFNITPTETMKRNVLGQEAAMWSEQVDDQSSESKIWPRAAALAERVWSDPDHDWHEAQFRMIHHRRRLVNRGVHADALQPEWCHQNQGLCYFDPSITGH